MKFQVTTAAPKRGSVSVERQTKWESLLFELIDLYVEEHPEGLEKLKARLQDTEGLVKQAS